MVYYSKSFKVPQSLCSAEVGFCLLQRLHLLTASCLAGIEILQHPVTSFMELKFCVLEPVDFPTDSFLRLASLHEVLLRLCLLSGLVSNRLCLGSDAGNSILAKGLVILLGIT